MVRQRHMRVKSSVGESYVQECCDEPREDCGSTGWGCLPRSGSARGKETAAGQCGSL